MNRSALFVMAVSLAAVISGCDVLGSIVVPGGSRDCGGLQGLSCLPWEYCNFEDGSCGAADQTGVCERRPEVCTEIYAPVCGCDDRTYGNECEAAGNGVSVAHEGPCVEGSGEVCGGIQGLGCPAGEYCLFDGEHCGAADQTGNCATIPDGCDDVFQPVCGCDGETYGNACEAAANSISIASEGECPDE
jgi:hypothetical protein